MQTSKTCINCGYEYMYPHSDRCPECGWPVGVPVTMYIADKTEPVQPIIEIPAHVKDQIAESVSANINSWLAQSHGMPITLTVARLGIVMVGMCEELFRFWYNESGERNGT